MAKPFATARLTDEVYEQALPLAYADEATGWPLLTFLQAIGGTVAPIEDLAYDTDAGPGWSNAVDVDRAPPRILGWLGQLYGVHVTPGNPADPVWVTQARDEVRNAAGIRRGTPPSLVGAVQATLTGMKLVRVRERDTSPYHLTVLVRTSECPSPALSEAAARSQKPAGLVLVFVVSDAPIIAEGTRTIDALAGTIDSATVANWT